ncbi:MAG TPA: type II CAAX endopeptidase family protein [Ktedonobacterales bacterium]|nr:type II CAAX endopeptidase family protein [Ktedonobacterales bacterium]
MSGSNTPPPIYPPQSEPPVPAPGASPGYPPAPGYPVYPQYPAYPGYPPQPQAQAGQGWSPNPAEAAHYGQVGRVPWSLRQTVIGATLTIVPWLAIIVVFQLLPSATGGKLSRLPTAVDLISGLVALAFTAIVEGAFVLAPLYFAVWRRAPGLSARDGLRALGLRKAPLWPSVGWVVLGFVIVLAASVIYGLLVEHFNLPLQTNGQALENQVRYAPITVTATLIGAVFVAPFCEELFFRGYLFGGLLRGMNVWLAVPLSALLFTLVHGDIGSAALLLVIGLVLAAMRYRLGSIWPGIALHALNNGLAAVSVLLILTRP